MWITNLLYLTFIRKGVWIIGNGKYGHKSFPQYILSNTILFLSDDPFVIPEDGEDVRYTIGNFKYTSNMKKDCQTEESEHLIVRNNNITDLPLEKGQMKGAERCKHLGLVFNKTAVVTKKLFAKWIKKNRKFTNCLSNIVRSKNPEHNNIR